MPGALTLSPLPSKYADFPPHLLCAVDCVALPSAVTVFGVPDESTNVEPVPSIGSNRATLANSGSPAVGVTAADAVLYAPVPIPFTAATRNVYAVPLVNPVTVALVAVDVPASLNVAHVVPLLLDN
jgi:hypothetical protein